MEGSGMTNHGIVPEDVREAFSGFVYFVRCGIRGPIKIGYATDPRSRLSHLQTSHFKELTLLGAYPGSIADEKRLHVRFASSRIRGEWFRGSAALYNEVRAAERAWAEHLIARNVADTAEVLDLIGCGDRAERVRTDGRSFVTGARA